MEIYVDELPDDCIDCPCESEYYCNLLLCDIGLLQCNERHPKCPLLKLSDRLAEERKKVIERIRELSEIYTEPSSEGFDFDTYILTEENLNKILYKAERGSYDDK